MSAPELSSAVTHDPIDPAGSPTCDPSASALGLGLPQHSIQIREQRLIKSTKYIVQPGDGDAEGCLECKARADAFIAALRAREPDLTAGEFQDFRFSHAYEGDVLSPPWSEMCVDRGAGGTNRRFRIADGERLVLSGERLVLSGQALPHRRRCSCGCIVQ